MINQLKLLPLHDQAVLLRVDFNVPLDKQLKILDNSRIVAALPTIQYLLSQNCKIVLMSHLGRPEGKKDEAFSLKPIAKELAKLLNKPIKMAPDCIGETTSNLVTQLKPGEILLLENLRFHSEEEKPEINPSFSEQLAQYGKFYIDDAFGCAHRAHSSIVQVPKQFPFERKAPGFLMAQEIQVLSDVLKEPKRPFLALIGGAKVSTKIGALKALVKLVDVLAIGGAMAFTFLKAQKKEVGSSFVEPNFFQEAQNLIGLCMERKVELLLPSDIVIAKDASENSIVEIVKVEKGIPKGYSGFDIGPETIKQFTSKMEKAKTIFWNGPMGVFEKKPFAKGTEQIAKAFVKSSAITIAGGGETLAALHNIQGNEKVTHLSTGGGATLEFIEFGTLPGIEILKK